MKKVVIVLLLVAIPLYLADMYAHIWAEDQIVKTVKLTTQPKTVVDAEIGKRMIQFADYEWLPSPMLVRMVSTGVIKDVDISMFGRLSLRNLSLDSASYHMDKIFINKQNAVSRNGVSIQDIRGAVVELRSGSRTLSSTLVGKPVTVNGIGQATVRIGGTTYPLKAKVTESNKLVFKANGQTLQTIELSGTPLMTCRPTAKFAAGSLVLSCPFTRLPGVLTGIPS